MMYLLPGRLRAGIFIKATILGTAASLLLYPHPYSATSHAEDLGAIPVEPSATETPVYGQVPLQSSSADTAVYRQAVATIESRDGAYAASLSESLLGLGLALQAEGEHSEAVSHFKRGVHLARINDGLYSASQIPLLQGEIASHIAQGDYSSADERQRYLYRVQRRAMRSGEGLATALMDQASWQFQAYRIGLGVEPHGRLVNMQDLYVQALADVMDREGSGSPELRPPLEGLLRTQYLIADAEPPAQTQSMGGGESWASVQRRHMFNRARLQSYEYGQTIISTMYSMEKDLAGDDAASVGSAEALAMLGDWHLYHGRRDAAQDSYDRAFEELATLDGAKEQTEAIFGAPVALPDIDELRPLPLSSEAGANDIVVEFAVTPGGRAVDIERLDQNEALDGRANRLLRKLRKTTFRPRFEAGQAVETRNLVYAIKAQ